MPHVIVSLFLFPLAEVLKSLVEVLKLIKQPVAELRHLLNIVTPDENLLRGMEEEVSSLCGHHRLTNIFLQNFEGRQNEDDMAKEVVSQITVLVHETEDDIDEAGLLLGKLRSNILCGRLCWVFNYKSMSQKIATTIEAMKRKSSQIEDRIKICPTETDVDAGEKALNRLRREFKEDDVVGFDDASTMLVKQLIDGNLRLDVVSLTGMCGSGKTTLAQKIYNSTSVQNHFEGCCMWVDVSQCVETRKLLLEILRTMSTPSELRRKLEDLNEAELRQKLSEDLKGQRYLMVLDNIEKIEVWDKVKPAFPNNSNGSRILITTRMRKLASYACHPSNPYVLPFLSRDQSWELFCKIVFQGGECPHEFECLGRQLAEGCCGLPLSIVVLGIILATKEKSYREWSKFVGKVNQFLIKEPEMICKRILTQIYTNLPPHLRPFFLYFGAYSKDSEIFARPLMQLVVAEGLLQHNFYPNPEDVAEDYLDELIDRSLLQVSSRRTDGGVKTCRMHNLLREFCILKSMEKKFLDIRTEWNYLHPSTARVLSIQGGMDSYISSNSSRPIFTRSLLFLSKDIYEVRPNHWTWVFQNLKFARVISFGKLVLNSIPEEMGELIYLRYFRTKSVAIRHLPASMCNIASLETIDLRGSSLDCLPKEIWKMQNLRNLYASGPVSLPHCSYVDLQVLPRLQVLSTISPEAQSVSFIAGLPNLKKLGICFSSDDNIKQKKDVLDRLKELPRLQTMKIISCNEGPILPVSYPSAATKITLRRVRIKARRDMKMLGKCANLRILKLQSCVLSSKLHVFAGSFDKLQVFILENLRIKRWKLRRKAMRSLKRLVIKNCPELTMLPSRLWSSADIEDVEISSCNSKLVTMLQELQMRGAFKRLILHELPRN